MGWRMRVRHRTGWRYAGEVAASYNEARLTPLATNAQAVLEHRVEVDPAVHLFSYVDYWGSLVHAFDLHRAHTAVEVTATSLVETALETAVAVPAGATWDVLSSEPVVDRMWEYLLPTRYVPEMVDLEPIAEAMRALTDPTAATIDVIDWVRETIAYEKGVTTVFTVAPEAFALRKGVCQDLVHVALALLRSLRIPCRYVSGYLYPGAEGLIGETVAGEGHAWVEAWLGGWKAFDPTNGELVAERHVPVAHGRDYADVTPLKGVYHGAPAEATGVAVELTRVG